MKLGVVVPCYNVAGAVGGVLRGLSEGTLARVDEILAVDNRSEDGTLAALRELQREGGPLARKLTVLRNRTNQGLGGTQKIAFDYFLKGGFTHVAVVHGDGQGDAEAILRAFLAELERDPAVEFVAASRFLRASRLDGYSPLRRGANRLFNALTGWLTGAWMSDAGCGIVLLRLETLRSLDFLALTNGAQFNPQLNILVYRQPGRRIREVPLAWRDSATGSSISGWNYSWALLKLLVEFRRRGRFSHPLHADWRESQAWRWS